MVLNPSLIPADFELGHYPDFPPLAPGTKREHHRPESRVRFMASGKSKRIWTEADTQAAIEAIRECRVRTGKLQTNAPIHSPPYRAITRLRREIDRLALVLTGEADYFMSPPPKSPEMGLIKPPLDEPQARHRAARHEG